MDVILSDLTRERVRSTFMEDFRAFMEESVPENRREFDWHDPTYDPAGMYVIDCKINSMPNLALYYDIELKEKLFDEATGGTSIPTTTIITSDRDFMPVINNLNSFFDIKEGSKEFYVRYDLITDFTHDHGKKLL